MEIAHLRKERMVKAIEVYGRKEGFTREAFLAYQTKDHMKAVGSVPEFSRWSRGATRNTIYTWEDGLALPKGHPTCLWGKDSVVELWFEEPGAAMAAFREPRYLEIVRPDEAAFSDVAGGWSLLCEERLILEVAGYDGREKVFLFLRRRDPATFDDTWGKHRGYFMSAIQNLDIGRIAENTSIPDAKLDNAGVFDFALELWCGDVQAAIEAAGGSGMNAILAGEASALFDPDAGSLLYLARERE